MSTATGTHTVIPSMPKVDVHPDAGGTAEAVRTIARRPWSRMDPAKLVFPITQTTWEERALLYWVASAYYKGEGAIIDAGCLAGSSTHALGLGLLENPRVGAAKMLHAYDLFRFEDYMRGAFSTIGEGGRAVGESFLDLFERLTAEVSGVTRVHAGDFLQERWEVGAGGSGGGGPVEVLFVDLAKNWELERHCSATFLPALIPGRSLLIQQDYFHVWCPWIHLRMDLLREFVEFAAYVPSGTAVFVVKKPIPRHLSELDLRAHTTVPDQVAKLERAASAYTGDAWAFVTLARAVLLVHHGLFDDALGVVALVDAVEGLGADIRSESAGIRSWISGRRGV
ncbi:MAG TPA: hypothetical protein VHN77_01900 [Phycisphaerales bacterium]|nr:hypothetical protein [Phycisphaerales bacterium]